MKGREQPGTVAFDQAPVDRRGRGGEAVGAVQSEDLRRAPLFSAEPLTTVRVFTVRVFTVRRSEASTRRRGPSSRPITDSTSSAGSRVISERMPERISAR